MMQPMLHFRINWRNLYSVSHACTEARRHPHCFRPFVRHLPPSLNCNVFTYPTFGAAGAICPLIAQSCNFHIPYSTCFLIHLCIFWLCNFEGKAGRVGVSREEEEKRGKGNGKKKCFLLMNKTTSRGVPPPHLSHPFWHFLSSLPRRC